MRFIFNKNLRYAALGALTAATIRAAGFAASGGVVPDTQEQRREVLTLTAQRILSGTKATREQWGVIESTAAEQDPASCRRRFQVQSPQLADVCEEVRQAWELSYSIPEF